MSSIHYLLILPAIFLFLLIRSVSFNSALSKLPGPTWARWTPFWRLIFVWDGKSPSKYYKLHQKYGPIVRTGPRCVDISDPAAIPIIYGKGPLDHLSDMAHEDFLLRGSPRRVSVSYS